jgi:hypothetical protein
MLCQIHFLHDLLRFDIALELQQFLVQFNIHLEFATNRVQHPNDTGDFVFGQEVDLQVQICSMIRLCRRAVLRDLPEKSPRATRSWSAIRTGTDRTV